MYLLGPYRLPITLKRFWATIIGIVLFILPQGLSAARYSDSELLALRQARHAVRQITMRPIMGPPTRPQALAAGYFTGDDWPVVLDDQPSRMVQKNPLCLAGNGDGGLVIFLDERSGPFGLWGVPVDAAGSPTADNSLIYAGSGLRGLGIPAGVRLSGTSSMLAFPEVDPGGIFVLSIGDDLAAQTGPSRVTPMTTDDIMFFDRPDIARTSSGAVVVWEDFRSGSRIYARFTDAAGVTAGAELLVHEDLTEASRWVPKVAAGQGDTALFVWEDYRSGEPDIYYRVFTGDGTSVTGDLPAASAGSAGLQYQPDVAYGADFGFLLTWIDTRDGNPAVYARLILPDGSTPDPEFVLANPGDSAEFWEPSLATDGLQQAAVVYESITNRTIITGQRLFMGAPFGNAFSISDLTADRERFSPSLALRGDGGMLAAWSDYREVNLDVRGRSLNINGVPLGNDNKFNDDDVGNQQWVGDGVSLSASNIYAAYTDQQRDGGDIYLQQVAANGQLVGDAIPVNDDTAPARQAEPAIDIAGDGTLLVVWTDGRGDQVDIYFEALASGATAGESNLRLSDDTNAEGQIQPDIAVFPASGALAVWTDFRDGATAAMYGQIISNSFELLEANFRISADSLAPDGMPGKVVGFNMDQAAIGWHTNGSAPGKIWIQWYNRAAGLLGDPFPVDNDSVDFVPLEFDLVALPGAGFGVFWRGEAIDRSAVFFQRYNNFFSPVGANEVISTGGNPAPGWVSVDIDFAGYMVFAWVEYVGGQPAVVRRVFDPSGTPIGPAEVVSDDAGNSISNHPVAVATGNYATVLYNDNRLPGKGFDVRASFYLYTPTGIFEDENQSALIPDRLELMQNYPNPFNPSTVISFSVPSAGEYELVVYDILGRQVCALAKGYFSAGPGSAVWSGADDAGEAVPSGIYFYRLRGAGYESTRKMMLVK